MTKPENTRRINQQLARRGFIGYARAAGVAMACRPIARGRPRAIAPVLT
ncbi:MAG: hypothetical protein ABI167_10785 [Nitrosospira sp.]